MKNPFKNIPSHLGTIFSTSFMLFLFGLIITALFLASNLSQYVRENMTVTLVVKQDLTEENAAQLHYILQDMPMVKSVVYIDHKQTLEELEKLTRELNLSQNPMEVLGYNPLFPSMEVTFHANFASSDNIEAFVQKLKMHKDVIDVEYQNTIIETVNRNIARIMLALFLLCVVFLFIVIVQINNTVRLNIYSRRFLFNTMKLVGADRNYIVRPIVRQQMINGVIAACLAIIALLQIQLYLSSTMGGNITRTMLYVSFLMLTVGALVTRFAAYFAAIRYLKRTTADLYHI